MGKILWFVQLASSEGQHVQNDVHTQSTSSVKSKESSIVLTCTVDTSFPYLRSVLSLGLMPTLFTRPLCLMHQMPNV